MVETEVSVSLTAFGYPPRPATAVIIEQTPAQRFARTLAGLGMFWGLALVGLFIPVVHFVLVPTFVAAGMIMAVKPGGRFASERSLDCPKCHGNLTLVATSRATRARSTST